MLNKVKQQAHSIPVPDKLAMDATSVAYHLDLSEWAIRQMVRDGKIPYRKLGDRVIFLVSELEQWLDELPGLAAKALRETPQPGVHRDDNVGLVTQLERAREPTPEVPMILERRPSKPLSRGQAMGNDHDAGRLAPEVLTCRRHSSPRPPRSGK